MEDANKVSVIIPSYNRGKTIEKAARSVLNQTYEGLELIIVDDGSSDDTKAVIKGIKDPRLRYIYQNNSGACAARNTGIREARYPFVAFQDSDDIWHPDKLRKQMNIMNTREDVDIVCCKTVCKRLDGSVMRSLERHQEGIIGKDTGPYGISTQTLLVRRHVFDEVLFDPQVTRYQDLDFLLSAFQAHTIYCVADYLVDREVGNDSITNHPERIYDMSVYFQKKHAEIMKDKRQFLSYFMASMLIDASINLEGKEKEKYIKKALELNKSYKIMGKVIASGLRI